MVVVNTEAALKTVGAFANVKYAQNTLSLEKNLIICNAKKKLYSFLPKERFSTDFFNFKHFGAPK
jgi:hypothetical protein